MGFWDTLGKAIGIVAGAAADQIKQSVERNQVYQLEMADKSDDELICIIKKEGSSSPMKSGAALKELRNRGYDQEEIKALIRNY